MKLRTIRRRKASRYAGYKLPPYTKIMGTRYSSFRSMLARREMLGHCLASHMANVTGKIYTDWLKTIGTPS